MTHFETVVTLLSLLLGMLGTLITVVWRARGWIDRLNTTDSALAEAIDRLATSQGEQHQANQDRFRALEARLDYLAPLTARGQAGPARGRPPL